MATWPTLAPEAKGFPVVRIERTDGKEANYFEDATIVAC